MCDVNMADEILEQRLVSGTADQREMALAVARTFRYVRKAPTAMARIAYRVQSRECRKCVKKVPPSVDSVEAASNPVEVVPGKLGAILKVVGNRDAMMALGFVVMAVAMLVLVMHVIGVDVGALVKR